MTEISFLYLQRADRSVLRIDEKGVFTINGEERPPEMICEWISSYVRDFMAQMKPVPESTQMFHVFASYFPSENGP